MKTADESFDLYLRSWEIFPVPPRHDQYLLGSIFQHIIQDKIQEWACKDFCWIIRLTILLTSFFLYDLHFRVGHMQRIWHGKPPDVMAGVAWPTSPLFVGI